MDEFFEEMIEASESLADADTAKLKELHNLVRQLEDIQSQVDMAEGHIKALKQERLRLSQDMIPALMDEVGVKRIDVGREEDDNVVSVQIEPFVSASIPVENRPKAYQWLRDVNCESIIKNDVTVSFGKHGDTKANDLMRELDERGLHPESKTHIHSGTLKSFIKSWVAENKKPPIDLQLFGAYVGKTTKIKRKS